MEASQRARASAYGYPGSGGGSAPVGVRGAAQRPLASVAPANGAAPAEAYIPASILLVSAPEEIDPEILQRLHGDGHTIRHAPLASRHAPSGEQALAILDLSEFDLVLLDATLPGISGFDTCRQLRARSDIAIIFLTRAASLPERLLGFDLGADDYLTAPAEFAELDRRMRAVLSRVRGAGARGGRELYGPEGVHMQPRAHQVFVGEQQIELTPKEYALLRLLLERQGEVLSSDEISNEIWGYETSGSRNFIEAHISRLRRKLTDGGAEDVVETVLGIGYAIRER